MLIPISLFLLLQLSAAVASEPEPDGARVVGAAPSFRVVPAPPAWLRGRSHAEAWVDTRHYLYEAYAGPEGQWLVRYVMLPEGSEAFREIEQAFLFQAEERRRPQTLKPAEVVVDPDRATWKKQVFTLVDRRDLLKP